MVIHCSDALAHHYPYPYLTHLFEVSLGLVDVCDLLLQLGRGLE